MGEVQVSYNQCLSIRGLTMSVQLPQKLRSGSGATRQGDGRESSFKARGLPLLSHRHYCPSTFSSSPFGYSCVSEQGQFCPYDLYLVSILRYFLLLAQLRRSFQISDKYADGFFFTFAKLSKFIIFKCKYEIKFLIF